MSGPDPFAFLADGGMTGDLMRALDWSRTPLGPLDTWSQPLRTATGVLLRSAVPIVMLWGEAGVMIYNDAYSVFAGDRHPQLLGSNVREGWAEIAEFNDHVMRTGLAGGTLAYRDQELTLNRHGRAERVWMDLDYSPVLDEAGRPAGVIAIVVETTARVLAEQQQATTNRRFAELFDQAPAFMAMLTGPEHRIALANPAYRRLVGGRDMVGQTVVEALPEAAGQGYTALLDDVYRTGRAYTANGARLVLASDAGGPADERFLDFVYQPIRDGAGTITGVLVQGIDMTDAHRAQAALRESEDHYRHAVELDPQTSWTATPDGRLDHVNRRWFDWTGTTGLDSTLGEGLHPDDRDRTLARWCQSLATGEPYDIQHRVAMRDGSFRWMHSRAFARRDDAGQVVKWYGTTEDVHERTLAEASLREESRLLEALNRTGAALAGELDLERVVQMVTDAGVELTGARFGAYFHNVMDETGERLHLFTLSGASRADFEHLGRIRATGVFGPTFRNEGVIRSDDILTDPRYGQLGPHHGMPPGHLSVRSYLAVPVVARGGDVLGGLLFGHPEPGRFTERHERLMVGIAGQAAIAIDNARLFEATERAKEELEHRVRERTLELEEAHEALRQSQKMEAVGQLTGGIAHDFNNMLAVVIGSLDLLGRRVGDADPRVRRYVDAATEGARRAATLTQRLLAFSRQQPLLPEPVDANRLVTGMSDLLRHSLGGDVRLELALAGDLWRTHADPNQLENAILNLAVNARDAMPDGGRLTVATRNILDHRAGVPADHVLVAVTDTGTGMPDSVIAKAFDPFFTTKEVGKGTGLGLSQVYGFVRQSGGHVKIRSQPGQGTTVEILLPRYHGADAEDAPIAPGHALPLGAEQEVVLVVEDEPAVRQFSTDALADLGYRVLEADGAAAALRLLDAHPEVALLFTDVVMPEVNGAKLAEEARRRRPDLRVLFTTGYTRDAALGIGTLDPGVDLLGKPYTVGEMAAKVRSVLDAPRP